MISVDEGALICDFAETYHILDYRALPVSLAATLACGLGDNSRIKRKMNNQRISLDTMLLAMAVDRLAIIAWMWSEDAKKGNNRPKSILEQLTTDVEVKAPSDVNLYASGEDFMKARAALIEKIESEG